MSRWTTPGRRIGREAAVPQELHHRPEPADALRLVAVLGPREDRQVELRRVEVGDGNQRQAVAGGRGDQVERLRGLQPGHQRLRSPPRVVGRDGRLEEHLAVGEAAEVEALGAGVDADDAGHGDAAPGAVSRQLARATS